MNELIGKFLISYLLVIAIAYPVFRHWHKMNRKQSILYSLIGGGASTLGWTVLFHYI